MPTKTEPKKPVPEPLDGFFKRFPGYKAIFDVIRRAADNGDLGLIAAREKETGRAVAVLAAFAPDGDGNIAITPLATLFPGNPYELLEDPTTDNALT